MQQLVFEAATFCGLGAAALAAMVMLGQGAGLASLLLRTMVIGGSVFLFAVLGGQVAGRILLEAMAKKELEDAEAKQEAGEQSSLKSRQGEIMSLQRSRDPKSVEKNPTSEDTVRSNAA